MKKIMISIFIVLFLIAVLTTPVKALDLNSLFANTTSTSNDITIETEVENEVLSTITTGTDTATTQSTATTRATLPEEGLGLQNILNILLIVVGTLLVLLSIAILIRLKK